MDVALLSGNGILVATLASTIEPPMQICYNFAPGKHRISTRRQGVNTRSKRLLRKFLCGIALVGLILSPGLGMAGPGSAHAGLVAVSPNAIYLPLVVRPPADQALTVKKSGSGSGRVTSSPSGIDCGSACSAAFNFGTQVTLTAAAGSGSTFSGWSGDCSGIGSCLVTMDAARSVTANFAVNTYLLRIGLSGTGSGTVTSEPAGIDCGSTCSAFFAYNTAVTLTAKPNVPSTFAGWNGGGCSGTDTCSITMNADQQVVATFVLPDLPCSGIANCNFESGPGVGWTEYSKLGYKIILDCRVDNCNDKTPHGGNYLAWLGGDDLEIAYLEQKQILIPSIAPYLMYWQWIESEDFCGYNYDYAEVLINATQVDKYDLCTGTGTAEWGLHTIDLTGFAGQSVTLRIQVKTDDSNMSNLYIDDVSILAGP
jgi:hypothetical protein